jgi:hypothetical protein
MLKFALVVILPLSIIFYGAYRPYLSGDVPKATAQKSGVLEKLIVTNGSAVLDLDLNKLNGTNVDTKDSRSAQIYLDAAADSFFSIKVFNGELRGPMPGTLPLAAKNSADIPLRFGNSLGQLSLEKVTWGDYELMIRDAKSGFTFFNIEGHTFDYDPTARAFSIGNGRLLLSKEFADGLGRPKDAGSTVGTFTLTSSMKQIEVAEIVDGEVASDTLPATGNPESGSVPGPDVVVGDLSGLAQFGNSANSQVGLAVGTDSCNFGTVNLNWFALPNNDHPVIPQNLYRMSGGANNDQRFEQIAQSNVKHAFQALTENICNLGCNGVGDTHLGSGCSDPYVASLNAGTNNGLGSRAWINPFSGSYPRGDSATPPNTHTSHTHNGTSHRMLANVSDLNSTLNVGAKYYAEAQYITPHEYAWCQANPTQCNMYNNVSYRRFNVSGTTCANNTPSCYAFGTVAGEGTVRQQPAIAAWPGSTRVEIRPDPGNDGIGSVSYKVTNTAPGVWHYEYAVYNQNLDRAIQSFSIPLGSGATLSNIEFHAPPQHPGWTFDGTAGNAGFSSAPWATNQTASSMTWSSETFAQNQNANAIRWGTLYNFRFDSNKPPQPGNATIGFFKTGAPINVAIQAPADLATNLVVSGRVTTLGYRGVGNAKITLSDGVNPPRITYTNSFGFYRFDNVTGGTYTITAFRLRHTFSQKQVGIFSDAPNLNFVSGQ